MDEADTVFRIYPDDPDSHFCGEEETYGSASVGAGHGVYSLWGNNFVSDLWKYGGNQADCVDQKEAPLQAAAGIVAGAGNRSLPLAGNRRNCRKKTGR